MIVETGAVLLLAAYVAYRKGWIANPLDGSFSKAMKQKRLARLSLEADQIAARMVGVADQVTARSIAAVIETMKGLERDHGHITNLSPDGLIGLAAKLRRQAATCQHTDVGRSSGIALMAAYVEAHAFSDEAAVAVRQKIEPFIAIAAETARRTADGNS